MRRNSSVGSNALFKVLSALAVGSFLAVGLTVALGLSLAGEMDSSYARGGKLYDK